MSGETDTRRVGVEGSDASELSDAIPSASGLRQIGVATAFWASVVIPVGYLVFALVDGLAHPAFFAVLLVVHATSLYVGHEHRR